MMKTDPDQAAVLHEGRGAAGSVVVAIGGSAGGLDAFRGLIAGLPANSGVAYVLVQHLDPDHPSILADLLARDTPFPVVEVTDGMMLAPDRLHVIPSGTLISVADGMLHLSPALENQGPRLPVDFLLQSMASEPGLRMVAVILSGNGADGREGVRAIHDAGGLVFVQDPAEAPFNSMPVAAIGTGVADAVLPVAAIGAAIMESLTGGAAPWPSASPHDWLDPVLARLKDGGHDFSGYKVGTLQRRIERRARMAVPGGADMPAYVDRLGTDPDELRALANDLLINVTSFFRDEEVFDILASEILPDFIRNFEGEGPLRIWCAGCSSGEEAWSLAILVLEELAISRPDVKLQLFATDLDAAAIGTARRGVYPANIAERVSAERLNKFFMSYDQQWRVGTALQSSVVFALHDLLIDPPFSRIDLVSCRNLLIYLQPEAQARAIGLFQFAIRPGGLLLLGTAEAVAESGDRGAPGFALLSKPAHLYRRLDSPRGSIAGQANAPPLSFSARAFQAPPWPLPSLPSTRLQALEGELASIKAELASANLHLEGAGAEQIAIHADTLSRNEEFQTANEELLTSQEELQSLNEELVALNGQLQETIDQQRVTSDDLQNILYSTDVATIFLDLNSNVRFFTPATRALFKLLPTDIGRPLADLAPLTLDSMLEGDIASVASGEKPIEREVETSGGTCFARRILPYRGHDQQIAGVIITYADVTVRNRATQAMRDAQEGAEAANLAKSRFLAAASHDLRQPLQALVLLQELLARQSSDPEMQVLLARLDHTLGSMTVMLDGLLDINRIEAGAVQVEPAIFLLDALLAETLEDMAVQAAARGLRLRHVHSGLHIVSDRRVLAGMVQNLVANALKYTIRGGVLVGARRRGAQVVIEVWDSGIGIPADEIEAVFRPYYQLAPAAGAANGLGLGLGLAIVRSLGNVLGHEVGAKSWLGHGSVFRISVPFAEPPSAPASPPEPAASSAADIVLPARTVANVLVIDDDAELLDLLGLMLRGGGHSVVLAPGEAEAVAAIKAQPFDLVISDFRLVGPKDGLQLAHLLRAMVLEREGRLLPVIMLTGDIGTETLARFAADDCMRLSKPVRSDALLAAIAAILVEPRVAPPAIVEHGIVHVIDDDPVLLRELSVLLAEAGLPARLHGSSESFRANWVPEQAGCLLVDAFLPGESGIALIAGLKAAGTLPPAIVLTGHGDLGLVVDAMKAGAIDFIEKPASGAVIIESIRRALASGRGNVADKAKREAAAARLAPLTDRQREVMHLVLAGHPSKNIAADLGLSQRTVENHRAEIMHRSGCRSLPELARLVMTAGPEAGTG